MGGRPIHVYGYDVQTEAGEYFRRAVLGGSYKWNCGLDGFADDLHEDGSTADAAARIAAAVAADPYGIGYAKLRYGTAGVRALALAPREGAPYIEPTRDNVQRRLYPLTRSMMVYLNRPPHGAVDAKVREFLRYVLSGEGQQEVSREGGYLPLPAEVAAEQLRKLE